MNNNLDKEKIEKKITEFYKALLNRNPDLEGLNHYITCVLENSLTIDEVYEDIKNSIKCTYLSYFHN